MFLAQRIGRLENLVAWETGNDPTNNDVTNALDLQISHISKALPPENESLNAAEGDLLGCQVINLSLPTFQYLIMQTTSCGDNTIDSCP
jgi:hypothetical protein